MTGPYRQFDPTELRAPGEADPTPAESADALSTAFYLLDTDAAGAYVSKHPEIGVVVVEQGIATDSPRVLVFGLSEHDFVAAENAVN